MSIGFTAPSITPPPVPHGFEGGSGNTTNGLGVALAYVKKKGRKTIPAFGQALIDACSRLAEISWAPPRRPLDPEGTGR